MKKSNRFANLFQVKQYSSAQSEDALVTNVASSDDVLVESDTFEIGLNLPQSKWEIPSKLVLASNWYVASGEDSEEKAVQKLRESSVHEALYQYSSFIPRNPFFPPDLENQFYDDSKTPLVPIIPIEETEATTSAPSNPAPSHAAQGDASLAAVAAATAIIKSMDPGSLIDTDLLIKILSDPEMTAELINKYRLANDNISIPSESSMPENAQLSLLRMPAGHTVSLPVSKPSMYPSLKKGHGAHDHGGNAYVGAHDYGLPDIFQRSEHPTTESLLAPTTAVPMLMDINYYKSLIKQHGEDPETRDKKQSPHRNMQANLQKHEISDKKYEKACKFFNSPKGCSNGSSCLFRHETYKQQRPNAKRMKLGSGRELLRRT